MVLAQPGIHNETLSQLAIIAMILTKSPRSSLSLFCMRRDCCLLHLPNEDQRGLRSSQLTQHFRDHCQSPPCTGAFGLGGMHVHVCSHACGHQRTTLAAAPQRLSKVALVFFNNIISGEETHVGHSMCGVRRAACRSLISPSTMGPTAQAQIPRLSSKRLS